MSHLQMYRGFEINKGDVGYYAYRHEPLGDVDLPGPSEECETAEGAMDCVDHYLDGKTLELAFQAFWAVVAAAHPECTSGDLSPLTTVNFEDSGAKAVSEWVQLNTPAGGKR
jgi:hypothetical protein